MVRKLLFILIMVNAHLAAMQFTPQEWMIKAHEYYDQGNYVKAQETFEKALKLTAPNSLDHVEALKMLAFMFIKGATGNPDYEKSLRYAQQGYNLCKTLLVQEPHNKSLLRFYAQLAQYLGKIYNGGPYKDWQKALSYFEESYKASADIPELRAANAYYLAALYHNIFGLDSEYEKTTAYLHTAIKLGKSLPDLLQTSKEMLAILNKDATTIELKDKTKKQINLDVKDQCGTGKKLSELLRNAESHNVKFIIARTLVSNPDGSIGSFYCSADYLMIWLWGKTAFGAFINQDDKDALALDAARKKTITDGRPIVGVEFFEWDPSKKMFTYLNDDRDFFEGYSGSRKRLFIMSQSYDLPAARPGALIRLSKLYHLGLGGEKNSRQALAYLEQALSNKEKLDPILERAAGEQQTEIWLDLAIEYEKSDPQLSLQYLNRAALQKYDKFISIAACMQLEKQYRATPKKALLFINLILSQKGMPIQIWQHYERIKEKLEKKLQEQEAKSKAEAQIAASKKAKKQSKISALQVASPAVPTAAQEPAQVTAVITEPIELKKPERESPEPEEIPLTLSTGEESQQEAEQEIDMLQKKERAKSLFKEFEERLAIYSSNPKRIAYLKDARDVLTQIKALALSDEHEVKKIAKAEQRLNAAFGQQAQESSSSETSSSTSATSAATIVLDLFDVERDIPDALQKRFKEIKAALAYNSRCCEAEKIESSSYPLYRIRLGEYRLIYIITAKFIGILDLEKREETTYKKIDTKYKEKIKEYNELATINSAELTKRIEKEKALGHEKYVKLLTDLLNSIKKG